MRPRGLRGPPFQSIQRFSRSLGPLGWQPLPPIPSLMGVATWRGRPTPWPGPRQFLEGDGLGTSLSHRPSWRLATLRAQRLARHSWHLS
eukprot:12973853-Alexandrium_andersonii.AAC.1